ncbi:MAG: isocitrate lyase/PEP mutase family protein [Thermoleophilia bacterium]|nr:isocitrate lyase/PEP mutase family protein [Thermoleophilia bacterium]
MNAADLRRLAHGGAPVVLPGVWDALSARLADDAGFPARFVSGYATAAARMAVPDLGYVGRADILTTAREVCGLRGAPVIVDADTGYGNALSAIRTARELHAAGAAGVVLEDQVWPKRCGHMEGKRVVPADEWLASLRAVVDLRADGVDLFVIARTDARAAVSLTEAIERARAAAALGVDAVFVEAPESEEELLAIAEGTPGVARVANMVEGGRTPLLAAARLHELGFTLIVSPLTGLFAATAALRDAFTRLRADGPTGTATAGMSFEAFNEIVGLAEHQRLERRYLGPGTRG